MTTMAPRRTAGDSRLPTDAPSTPPAIELTASTAATGQPTGYPPPPRPRRARPAAGGDERVDDPGHELHPGREGFLKRVEPLQRVRPQQAHHTAEHDPRARGKVPAVDPHEEDQHVEQRG